MLVKLTETAGHNDNESADAAAMSSKLVASSPGTSSQDSLAETDTRSSNFPQNLVQKEEDGKTDHQVQSTLGDAEGIDPVQAAEQAAKAAEDLQRRVARKKNYETLVKLQQEKLDEMEALVEDSLANSEPIDIRAFKRLKKKSEILNRACADKYRTATSAKPRRWAIQGAHPKIMEEQNARLVGEWESNNPWIISKNTDPQLPTGGLLMRVEDGKSIARILAVCGVCSQGSPLDLSTRETRKVALKNHLNWRNKEHTALISTTADVSDFHTYRIIHALKRDAKSPESTVKLIFFNGNARRAEGCITLKATQTMAEYEVQGGRKDPEAWFIHEYPLLFRAPPSQIVATYCWPIVKNYMAENRCSYFDWHNAVVVPAFAELEAARKEKRPVRGYADCVCCGH